MISGAQIRMARAYMKWSASELAKRADVGISTVQRIESSDGVPAASAKNVAKIQDALEANGVAFFQTDDGRDAVAISSSAT